MPDELRRCFGREPELAAASRDKRRVNGSRIERHLR
jgi:hypothetical protein